MRRFVDLLLEREVITRKIVMINADHDTTNALRAWAQKQGFDLTTKFSGSKQTAEDFDFHITVIASNNAVHIPIVQKLIEPIKLKAAGFEVLGREKNIPTLKLEATDKLMSLRHTYLKKGMDPTFPDFKPHVSLSYSWNGKPDLKSLKLPDFEMTFNEIVIQDFDPG